MTVPKISIILPVYNVELYLDECLRSVEQQTYENYELIAINDGSTDNSLNILEQYLSVLGDKLRIINQENKGLSSARNAGLENATGQYIYFLDSDDWILPETLENCVETFIKTGASVVVFDALAFCDGVDDAILQKLNYTRSLPQQEYSDGLSFFFDSRTRGNLIVQSCCFMYKLSSHKKLRFIPGILHEDNYFSIMLFLEAEKIAVRTDRFFQRRIRKDSITTSVSSMKHAVGYYATVKMLTADLPKKYLKTNEMVKHLNYLILQAVKIEKEVKNHSLSVSRRLALAKDFRYITTFKTKLKILLPDSVLKRLGVSL